MTSHSDPRLTGELRLLRSEVHEVGRVLKEIVKRMPTGEDLMRAQVVASVTTPVLTAAALSDGDADVDEMMKLLRDNLAQTVNEIMQWSNAAQTTTEDGNDGDE